MSDQFRYEDHHKIVLGFAYRVLRRARAAGVRAVELEDVIGELQIAWCRARDHYDPALGVPFEPYLRRGMQLHINRWIQGEIDECIEAPYSLDANMAGDEDAGASHEIITSPAPALDEELDQRDRKVRVLRNLSPLARRYIQLLENPPAILREQAIALRLRAEYGRSRGLQAMAPGRVNALIVARAMGLTPKQRKTIGAELTSMIEKVRAHGRD